MKLVFGVHRAGVEDDDFVMVCDNHTFNDLIASIEAVGDLTTSAPAANSAKLSTQGYQ